MIIGSFFNTGILQLAGLEANEIMKNAESIRSNLSLVKLSLLIMHLFSFLLPALLFGWMVFKSGMIDFYTLHKKIPVAGIGAATILLLLSIPVIQYTYEWNQQLPLPEWMRSLEAEANETLISLIRMDSLSEWIINILLIAILPALGEELVFRGVIQQYGYRFFKNPHWSVWLSAVLFSAIHLQFEGFVPRFLLGLLLGYLFLWTKNLWYPIFVHFINNAIMVTLAFFIPEEELNLDALGPEEIPLYAVLGSVILLYPAVRIFINNFETSEADPSAS